jgi:hypothetical protein
MTEFTETAPRTTKTERLAAALLADRGRVETHHNIWRASSAAIPSFTKAAGASLTAASALDAMPGLVRRRQRTGSRRDCPQMGRQIPTEDR